MIIENIGNKAFQVNGRWICPGQKMTFDDNVDLSGISEKYRVYGMKIKEPVKGSDKLKEE